MSKEYLSIKIAADQALEVASRLYEMPGEIIPMPGDSDFNFKLIAKGKSYLLKISRPNEDLDYVKFQCELLQHVEKSPLIESPKTLQDVNGNFISEMVDVNGEKRVVRLLTWMEGRLWSSVNPILNSTLLSLGQNAGTLTQILEDFNHPFAERYYEWDIAQALWCNDKLQLFSERKAEILSTFLIRFKSLQDEYALLRKSVIHSDVNDNNIIVNDNLKKPGVKSIIDFGDAVKTQTINDLAILLAYAVMHKEDVLAAAIPVIQGYHEKFPLREEELKMLHTLVAMRLTITVTKSAMNQLAEPENEYHQISEKPAWDVLGKWIDLNPDWVQYNFRKACGFNAHPSYVNFTTLAETADFKLQELFPSIHFERVEPIDMSVGSTWLGHATEYDDLDRSNFKLSQLRKLNSQSLFAGGYLEVRPFYSTNAYKKEGNSGPEYRTVHLGVDFWVEEQTPIRAFCDAEVVSIHNNDNYKDYGPTLILKHEFGEGETFYTLYGHLSKESLTLVSSGDRIKKGDLIGTIGNGEENGNWTPHLHFQIMLDLLGNKASFPGVAYPDLVSTWEEVCPNPGILFSELNFKKETINADDILDYRKEHLGKSLSVSYEEPLNMLRGEGVHLIDSSGRRFLDTVNNVAHVGHEHPRVVKAGKEQMNLLNTNTRYLHGNINSFAKELLETFPEELSVVHFVNSGSEANELAMRMCQSVTKERDMIAVEIGYHGNTSACINVSSYKFDGKGGKGAPEHTHIVPLPDRFRGMYTGSDAGEKYVAHIQQQIDEVKSKGRNIAGFICESIISCGGQIELPENYLKTAYETVRKAGGICISDEVQVGIGRVGSKFWGFQLHGVVPDIVTIGKPLGNGHPIAAVVCTKEVAESFANGMEYFNTFGGNPVSCAIGREVLRVVKDENLQENALEVGNYLKEKLQVLQSEFPIIQDIRGQGLFLGFELVDEKMKPLADKADYLANRMKDYAILMSTDGKDHNAIKIKPPVIFSRENADELISRMRTILQEDFIQSE